MSIDCAFHTFDRDRLRSLFSRPTEAQRHRLLELASEMCGPEGPRVARALIGRDFGYDGFDERDHHVLDRLVVEVLCDVGEDDDCFALAREIGAEEYGCVRWNVPEDLRAAAVESGAAEPWVAAFAAGRRLGRDEAPQSVHAVFIAPDELGEAIAQLSRAADAVGMDREDRDEILSSMERARRAGRWFLAETLGSCEPLEGDFHERRAGAEALTNQYERDLARAQADVAAAMAKLATATIVAPRSSPPPPPPRPWWRFWS